MKLRLRFGKFNGTEETLEVEWDGTNVKSFPIMSLYKNAYWQFVFIDDRAADVDYELLLSETKASALPVDMFGQPFPVTNLHEYFKLDAKPAGPCECGAKFTAFPTIHAFYCPQWSK